MSVFLSCGEASGDVLMAGLAKAMRREGYNGVLWGMGGPLSREAGVLCKWSASELQIMGITEPLKALPRLLRLADAMAASVCSLKPRAVVVVDSPDFHIPFVLRLRKKGYGGKTVFLSPPTVWAWRKGRALYLRDMFDLCLPLFGFEDRFLARQGVRSAWTGHPMAERFPKAPAPLNDGSVAILPGSRESEIKRLLPVLIPLAEKLRKDGKKVVFSVARGLKAPVKQRMVRALRNFDTFQGEAWDLLSRSHMAVGASGTVAVEAMMADRFMAVLYKAGTLECLIYKAFVDLPFVAMPNIILGREIYPELLQDRCTPRNIAMALNRYETDEAYRDRIRSGLSLCRASMGRPGAFAFWARRVLSL